MATSNPMSTSNTNIKYTISITQNSQSIIDNTSNVTVSVRFYRTNTGYESYGTGTVYCKINGVQYTANVTSSQKITSSGITLFTKTLNISHNADGTKTLVTSAWINHSVVTSVEQSYSQALTTIPRATTPTLSSTSTEMGNAVTITMNRASISFTHTLSYKFGNVSGTLETGLGTSYSWTIPLTLANQIPNATSGTGTITCQTYSGSTLIGTKSISFIATVPNTVVPVINSVAVTETVTTPDIATKFSGFVQSKSKPKIVTTATGAYGSTIQTYKVYIRDSSNNNLAVYSGADVTIEPILISGTVKVVVSVTDSRGRTASYSQDITVLAYESPKISGFTGFRCNSDGTANYEGECLNISLNFNIATVNNLNDKYYEVDYRVKGTTEWTVLVSNNIYSRTDSFITTATFSGDNAYELKLQLYDFFDAASVIVDIPTAFTLVDFRSTGKGIAFGKVSEADRMEIALDVELTGELIQEARQNATLQNSWVNYGSAYESATFWKDKCGVVHLAGLIKGGTTTAETVIFTLPEGYRPRTSEKFFCVSMNAICVIDVYSNGAVAIKTGANSGWLSLSGINFRAA